MMNRNDVTLRLAEVSDAPALLEIYAYYVENTAITFEYEAPSPEEFEERIRCISKKYPYLVAEVNGEIVGYSYAGAFYGRAAYDWSVETTIYIRKDKKVSGIGRMLYCLLEKILKEQNILNLNACIADPNDEEDEYLTRDSEKFHKKMGYHLAGRFHKCGYKFGNWYSMIWMEKHIGEHPEKQPDMIPFEKIRQEIKKKYHL